MTFSFEHECESHRTVSIDLSKVASQVLQSSETVWPFLYVRSNTPGLLNDVREDVVG
jgi:hypothetical protein